MTLKFGVQNRFQAVLALAGQAKIFYEKEILSDGKFPFISHVSNIRLTFACLYDILLLMGGDAGMADRTILHCDLNSFYASVELLDRKSVV